VTDRTRLSCKIGVARLHHVVSHVIVFVELTFLFGGGVLVLLVLGDKIVHVGLGLGELHLVHAFTSVPVQECLTTEHSSELLGYALEHFLDGGTVADERGGHLQTLWWDITHGGFDVVGDPLDEVGTVLVLYIQHLLVDFFGRHAATEHAARGQVATVAWVGGAHHVLGVELLLGQFWDGQGAVLLGSTTGQWGETNHEKVQTRERDHVDGDFAQITVQLTWEAQAARNTGHGGGYQVVKVTVGWGGQLQGTEADVVQGFVVQNHDFVGVFNQLVDRQGRVVGLHHGIGYLWGGEHGERHHDTVWVLFADLGDQQSSHSGSRTTAKGVGDLETLKAVAGFGFLADDVQNTVDQLGTFGVVTFGPVVTGTSLSENKVVWAEELTEGTGTDGVHGSWFQVHKDGAGYVASPGGFVEVNIDAFQLQIGITVVGTGWVYTVLVGDDFPEFGTDLVTALSALYVNDFSHLE